MTDRDYLSFSLLTIFVLLLYIAYLRRNRDYWKTDALRWTKWLNDESLWNNDELLAMLTQAEKELYHRRREFDVEQGR